MSIFSWITKMSQIKNASMSRNLEAWINFDPEHRKKENMTTKQRQNCFMAYCEYQKGNIPISYNYGEHFDANFSANE